MTNATTDEVLQLLVFELSGMRCALELVVVREVVRAVFVSPLPGAPPVIEGVIDVRGEVVPVYDFRARFGLPPERLHPDQAIILAWTGERRVGIRCDSADWLHEVPRHALREAPEFRGQADTRLAGVAHLEDGLVLIHDLPAFLDEAETAELAQALHARADGSAER